MRRNNSLMGRLQNTPGGGGAPPLMSNHLKDIDLELELLKRKREMIEQQQLLLIDQELAATRQYNSNYNSSYGNNDFNSRNYATNDAYNQDYSNNRGFSNDRGFSNNSDNYRNQFGRKRQADPQWKNDFNSKKPAKQARGNLSNFGNRSGPSRGQSGPSFAGSRNQKPGPSQFKSPKASATFSSANTKQYAPKTNMPFPKSQKNFTPTKVTKPKASMPNKFAPPTSNKLTTNAFAERTRSKPKKKAELPEETILLPDRTPTQQMAGRLELALGSIMKDIREKYGLRSLQLQRCMKQTVRERIRNVMLGKVVGTMSEILAHYREEFPPESDSDILNKALDTVGERRDQRINLIQSDNPEDFFRKNMTSLLDKTLREMFTKVEEIYSNTDFTNSVTNELIDLTENKTSENKDNTEKMEDSQTQQPEEDQNVPKEEPITADGENTIPNEEQQPTEGVTQLANEQQKASNEEQQELNEEQQALDEEQQTITEEQEIVKEDVKDTEKKEGQGKREYRPKLTEKDYEDLYRAINPYTLKRIMPRLIKKYIPYMVKLLNLNGMYQSTKAYIINKTNEKASDRPQYARKGNNNSKTESTPLATSSPSKLNNAANLPYFVKIMGRPSLPKRKVMQAFLDQFNPKSIKKHRSIHNLLFIGFGEKNDYDSIIGADGTQFGRITLSIRTCEKTTPPDTKTNNKSADSISDIINPDLDSQINDLLSSIKEAEEEENAKNIVKDEENTGSEVNTEENIEGNEENVESNETNDLELTEAVKDEISEPMNANGNSEATDNVEDTLKADTNAETGDTNAEKADRVEELKNVKEIGKATPTRASSRLATTPSTIRTRRASKMLE